MSARGATTGNPAEKLPGFMDVVRQFKRDVYDKEVQSAATYSYLWLADQMGHIGLGILLTIIVGLICQLLSHSSYVRVIVPMALSLGGCAVWEVNAFRTYAGKATGVFPPDTKMLASNAAVASLYMFIGVALGMSWMCALLFSETFFLWPSRVWTWIGIATTLASAVTALGVAYPWVRQKMIWQKAGMPFLFRLANAPDTVSPDDAKKLQDYAERHLRAAASREAPTPVVVLSGELWAGKTSIACGIGTEAAFRNLRVRYVTFDKLGQMAAAHDDDLGPSNINYWRWRASELVIIDDINSGSATDDYTDLDDFKAITAKYGLPGCFAGRITVWVIGPKEDAELAEWQKAIAAVCAGASAGPHTAAPPEMLTMRLMKPSVALSPAKKPSPPLP